MQDDSEFMPFSGLTRDWAVDVATRFDRIAGDRRPPIDDLWVSDDLALVVRYRLRDLMLGVRFGQLDVDPTSGLEPIDSGQLAALLYHNLHAASPENWTDDDGYRWLGRPPRCRLAGSRDQRATAHHPLKFASARLRAPSTGRQRSSLKMTERR